MKKTKNIIAFILQWGTLFLTFLCLFSFNYSAYSACMPTPTSPFPFSNATTTSAAFGSATVTTIASSVIPNTAGNYVFSGSSHTISSGDVVAAVNLYVKSGQNLTISHGYNVNSGGILNIYVEAGGTFTYTAGSFQGGKLFIWGNMVLTSNAELRAVTGVYIGPSAVLSAPAQDISIPSTGGQFLLDGGLMNVRNLSINVNGSLSQLMCMKNSGCITVEKDLFNDEDGPFSTPDGTGYLYLANAAPALTGNDNFVDVNNPLNVTTNVSSTTGAGNTQARFCSTTDANMNSSGTVNAACLAKVTFNKNSSPNIHCGNPLPIVLIYFETKLTQEGIRSSWATTKQQDLDYFIIEKSKNGIDWEYVNTVASEKNSYQEYSITDYNPLEGDSYYRLVEVDTKGNQTVYAIEFVHSDKAFRGFSIYPNPSNGDFVVNISGDFPRYDLSVLDVTGRNLGTYVLSTGKNEIEANLPTGVYLAKLKIGHDNYTQKIIVQ